METVAVKLDRRHLQLLKARAKVQGCSPGAVVWGLIDRHLGSDSKSSLHDLAQDLCGSVSGPKDLSTRALKGYGRD